MLFLNSYIFDLAKYWEGGNCPSPLFLWSCEQIPGSDPPPFFVNKLCVDIAHIWCCDPPPPRKFLDSPWELGT